MGNTMNLFDRIKASTPKIFRIIRNTGFVLAAAGGVIIASPIALPATVVSVSGYLVDAGGVMTAVSQAAVDGE